MGRFCASQKAISADILSLIVTANSHLPQTFVLVLICVWQFCQQHCCIWETLLLCWQAARKEEAPPLAFHPPPSRCAIDGKCFLTFCSTFPLHTSTLSKEICFKLSRCCLC